MDPERTGQNGRVVVIGASGTIGRRLVRVATGAGRAVIATSRAGGEGRFAFDPLCGRLLSLVPDLGPGDCVYLMAAISNPNQVHDAPAAARALNVDAMLGLAQTALGRRARVVFPSSELVFGCSAFGCDEGVPPSPGTLYGRLKVEVETAVAALGGDWCVVRTGANVGERPDDNCVVAKTYRSLLTGGARMAVDNVFSLTDGGDVAAALLRLSQPGLGGIWHCAGQPVERLELARWVMEDSRYRAGMAFTLCRFDELNFPEPRPCQTWLDSGKIIRELGVEFHCVREAVRRQVAVMDAWMKERR